MKKILTLLLRLVAMVRGLLNPPRLPADVEAFKREMASMSIDEFSRFILAYEYKPDALGGLIDRTETWEHFIDSTIKSGRDCDDFAAAWRLWLLFNGYEVATVIVTTPKHLFKKSHVIAIAEKGGRYTLCNYSHNAGYKSFRAALGGMKYGSYADGFIYAIQDVYKLEDGRLKRVKV